MASVLLTLAAGVALPLAPVLHDTAAAEPRPRPAPLEVDITAAGFSPADVAVVVGQSVRFTNSSGSPQTVTASDGTFDSGPIPAGGGFSLAIGRTGSFPFASSDTPTSTGSVTVGKLDLDGPPDALVAGNLPELPIAAMTDPDELPDWGIGASRTRLLVAFADDATIGQANAALAAAGVKVVGTLPSLGSVVVAVDDPGPGDMAPVIAAVEVLRAQPGVEAAAHDLMMAPSTVPKAPEAGLDGGADSTRSWTWQDERWPDDGRGFGRGGNWGLEAARFPQAWNWLDGIRLSRPTVQTLVIDSGFFIHDDLKATYTPLCRSGVCTSNSDAGNTGHGTHVAGTIGATFDNDATGQPGKALGVDGANPVANLSLTSFDGLPGLPAAAIGVSSRAWSMATWTQIHVAAIEAKTGGTWPNLRVINMSYGEWYFTTDRIGGNDVAKWGRLFAGKHCGPGLGDDATGTVACRPENEDKLLREVAHQGVFAERDARLASAQKILLSVAAGNESDKLCVVGTTTKQPPCAAGQFDPGNDTTKITAFGWASKNWTGPEDNPILMVGAANKTRERPRFSNTDADISAPGVDIESTIGPLSSDGFAVGGRKYGVLSGTSMAAPHVTALAGYLLAFRPTLEVKDLKRQIITYGQESPSGPLSIDAYRSMLALPGALTALVDVNDQSLDGNRRVVRAGTTSADLALGPTVDGRQLHSSPDGKVDLRDVRRYRDAVLETCASGEVTAGCPTPILLDGADDHPKKDLNFDGCVIVATPACTQTESKFSRFDFNGDGTLDPTKRARVPLVDGNPAPDGLSGDSLSDLDLLRAAYAQNPVQPEGWRADQLTELLSSADLEVHAKSLFDAGSDYVDIEVSDAADNVPPQRITDAGLPVIVTVPVNASSRGAKVRGVGYKADGTKVATSLVATSDGLVAGEDRRVDVCVPTVSAVPAHRRLFGNGTDTTDVTLAVANCGRPVAEGIELEHSIVRQDGTPATATLSGTTSGTASVTDATGRATIKLRSGLEAEHLRLKVVAKLETDPDHAGLEDVTTTSEVVIDPVPRLVFRWEQVTDDWHAHRTDRRDDDGDGTDDHVIETDYTPPDDTPLVVQRSGSLTPVGDGDARLDEVTGADAIPYRYTTTDTVTGDTTSGAAARFIPTSERDPGPILLSTQPIDYIDEHGAQHPPARFGQTSFDVGDDEVVVDGFGDLGWVGRRYSTIDDCDVFCRTPFDWDQLGLAPRVEGSALAFANDLSRPLTFTRRSDGSFATYFWCSAPKTFTMRGSDVLAPLHEDRGTARSRFRFIATITTDPSMTPDDLALPESCVEPQPPVAAIARDFVDAKEGQLVRFLDASSDPNGDVVDWRWDFGDGTTSTEQFPEHRFADDGTYRVTFTATDATGLTDTDTLDVTISNAPPEVTADDAEVGSGEPVNVALRLFDPGARDQEALRLSLAWDEPGSPTYPESTVAGGAITANLGPQPDGVHHLRVTLQDKDDLSATATVTVTVGDAEGGTIEPDDEIESEPAPACSFGVKQDLGEADLTDLVRQYRQANDRAPVHPSPTLSSAALAQARWLRDNDAFAHEGESGSTPASRAAAAGYPGGAVQENLARGPRAAPGALVAWRMSPPHDAALLDPRWHAVGIAKVDTIHGTLWVVVFGDELDCPLEPPDFDTSADPPDPPIAPIGTPPTEVLSSSSSSARAAEPPSPPSVVTPPLDVRPVPPVPPMQPVASVAAPAPAAAAAAEPVPVAAFTSSSAAPQTGDLVTITNRSSQAASFTFSDGRAAVDLTPASTTPVVVLVPGPFTVHATVGSLVASFPLTVDGSPRPPVVTATGASGAVVGQRVLLQAHLATAAGTPVPGRAVVFRVGGRELSGTTDGEGDATAELLADLAPGTYDLTIDAAALASGGPGASITVPFVVTANGRPVVDVHGPYDLLVGDALDVDLSGTFDPDGQALQPAQWDLDGDGAFDDFTGDGTIPAATVTELVCGGACDPAHDETILARVVDSVGGETTATATVRFHRDFSLSVTPGAATLNPGGSTSFSVTVSTGSGFADPVALTIPDLPSGVTATFDPPTVSPTAVSVLTLTAAVDVTASDAPFTVRGTSGATVHDATSTVDVEIGLIPVCYGAVDIRVVDDETGAPIEGAQLGPFDETDADGRFSYDQVELGANNRPRTVFFAASKPGYYSDTGSVLAACHVRSSMELRLLVAHQGALAGRVVVGIPDPASHQPGRAVVPTDTPIPGAFVRFNGGNDAQTGADGSYAMANLPLGANNQPSFGTVKSFATEYWTEQASTTIEADRTSEVSLAMVRRCFGSVDARVVDAGTGRPMPGVDVVISFPNPNGITTDSRRGVTDANGRVRLDEVGLGFRNAALETTVFASTTINGRSLGAGRQVRVETCGSVGVVDLAIATPVERRSSVTGRVTDADTGAPIADAPVSVGGYAGTTTDADGRYEMLDFLIGFDDNTTASTAVTVQAPPSPPARPYLGSSAGVTLHAGETSTVDLTLTPVRFAALEVRVLDAGSGAPVVDAVVEGPNVARTDDDGIVRFTDINTGNHETTGGLLVTMSGYVTGRAEFTLTPGETTSVEVRIERLCGPATIKGLVRNAETGEPLPGARVETSANLGARLTDADGRFVFDDQPVTQNLPTRYRVTASKEGFLPAERFVTVYCGASITVDLGAPAGGNGSLSGRVTNRATGTPVAGVLVGGEWGDTTTTDADGRYAFAQVPAGPGATPATWLVDAVPAVGMPFARARLPVTIHSGEASVLDFALDPPAPNAAPTVEDQTIEVAPGTVVVRVDLLGHDPDGDPLTYRVFDVSSDVGVDVHDTYLDVHLLNAHEAHLRYLASDGRLDSAPGDVTITETDVVDQPPIAVIAPVAPVVEGATAALDGSTSSDPEGRPLTYAWDLDGDGAFDDAAGPTASRPTTDDATIDVGLRVTDEGGNTATAAAVVVVQNAPPIVIAGADVTLGQDGHLVRNGSFTDVPADAWSATVDWGDGAGPEPLALAGTTFVLDHTFAGAGTRAVTVSVCDDDGGCGAASVRVTAPDATTTTSTSTSTTSTSTSTSTTTSTTTSTSTSTTSTTSSTTSTSTTSTTSTTTTPSTTSTSTTSTLPGSSTSSSTSTSTSTTASSTTSTGSTTTSAPTSTTTTEAAGAPATTTEPPTTSTLAAGAAGTTTTTDPGSDPAVSGTSTTGSLPVTGVDDGPLALLAAALVLVGLAATVAARRGAATTAVRRSSRPGSAPR